MSRYHLDHLQYRETEAIHIMREVAAKFERPSLLFSGGKDSICILRLAEHRINISNLEAEAAGAPELAMNDMGEIRLKTAKPIIYDGYTTNRLTGSFILIEPDLRRQPPSPLSATSAPRRKVRPCLSKSSSRSRDCAKLP